MSLGRDGGAWAACALALLETAALLRMSDTAPGADPAPDHRLDAVEHVREVAVVTEPGVTEILRLWCTGLLLAHESDASSSYAGWLEQCAQRITEPESIDMLLDALFALPGMPIPPSRLQSIVAQRLSIFAAAVSAEEPPTMPESHLSFGLTSFGQTAFDPAAFDEQHGSVDDMHAAAATDPPAEPSVVWLSEDERSLLVDAIDQQLGSRLEQAIPASANEALEGYCEQLALVLDAFGLLGLGDWSPIGTTFRAELAAGMTSGDDERAAAIAEVQSWHHALKAALLDPTGPAWPQLRHCLTSSARAVALSPIEATGFDRLFIALRIGDDPAQWDVPATVITDADASLDIAAEASAAVVDGLMRDAPRNMNGLSAAIDRFLDAADSTALIDAQRIAHTMKGDANTVGVRGIGNVSHALEDVLVALAKYPALRTSHELRDLLRGATDVLGIMVDAVTGHGEAPPDSLGRAMLQRLVDARPALREHSTSTPEYSSTTGVPIPPRGEHIAATASGTRAGLTPVRSAPVSAPIAEIAGSDDLVVSAHTLDHVLQLVDAAFADLRQVQRLVDDLRITLVEQRRIEAERQGLVGQLDDLATLRGAALASSRTRESTLDPLELDHFHELHQITQRFLESRSDRATVIDATDEAVSLATERCQDQERVHEALRRELLSFRTVPIADHVFRWQRVVRQTARNVGKNVELVVHGQETRIDRDVLEGISDAVAHVLRNAVDHGIEPESERLAVGKPPQGRIDIDIVRSGLSVTLRIRDDGRGLDEASLRMRADDLGIAIEDVDLWSLLSKPGFTTRESASAVSGRGLGLDIVAQALRRWRASARMTSVQGSGLSLELQIPITHVTVPVLVTSIGDGLVAISAPSLNALRQLVAEEISGDEQGRWCEVEGGRAPLLTLADLYGTTSRQRLDRGMLLPLETHWSGSAFLALETVVAIREVVVRPLPAFLGTLQGVRGVATFEDGRAMPVLDLNDLPLDEAVSDRHRNACDDSSSDADVLIVDDSLSVRRAVAEVLGEAGLRTSVARDGLEAMSFLQRQRPRVVVADLEMPRINGLELTAHMRRTPELARVPVLLLTSRMGRRHRAMAHTVGVNRIMFKPYDAKELVDTVADLAEMGEHHDVGQVGVAPPNG